MTTTAPATAATRPSPDPMRRARIAGALYLPTFVSIPTSSSYKPVKDDVGAFLFVNGSKPGAVAAFRTEQAVR